MKLSISSNFENQLFELLSYLSLNLSVFRSIVLSTFCRYEGSVVLDFGCGTGMFCEIFNKNGYVGVDISESRILYARKKYPDYRFEQFTDLNHFNKVKFDKILCLGVLHHIDNDMISKLLSKFYEMLNSNGIVLAIEPTITNFNLRDRLICSLDRGAYVRSQKDYLDLIPNQFEVEVSKVNPPLVARLWSSDFAYVMKKIS